MITCSSLPTLSAIPRSFGSAFFPTIASLPAGTFIEGIRLDALYKAYRRLYKSDDKIGDQAREHVTPSFYSRPKEYKIKKIVTDKPKFLLSINTLEDYERVKRLYKKGLIK